MANDWIEVTVEDIKADTPNSLATGPFGSAISSRYFVDAGVPVLRGSNLSQDVGTRLIETGLAFVSLEKGKEFSRSIAKKGDLVFTCWGTIDQVGLIDDRCQFLEYVVSNKQMKFTPAPSRADSLFLYYLFSSPQLRGQILSHGIGSSVPGFNLGQLRSMKLELPPIEEQHAIARGLGSLDDKIELNRKMNETLEAMARALFKSWFVDFDPVRAKAEGRDINLPTHIVSLFPDTLVESPLGPVPQGWNITTWGTVATLEYGKPLRGYNTETGKFPVYGTNGKIGTCSKPLCPHPGVIIGRKGAYRGVHYSSSPFFAIDTAFYVAPKISIELRWAYYEILRNDINGMDSGSAIPSTSREDFYNLPVVVPPAAVQQQFTRLLATLWQQQEQNQKMSATLADLRDTLLPKLISGEIRVAREHCI